METNQEDIYSKWLNNELTQEELKQLELSGDLVILNKIKAEMESWKIAEPKSNFADLQKRKEDSKKKGKMISLYKRLAVAASLLILITAGFIFYRLFNAQMEYQTSFGETKEISLPDDTKVTLFGNSTLSYYEYEWNENRIVSLSGKARFDIGEKGDFEVVFEGGNVKVTGTIFEVLAGENFKSVKCFEGSVVVVMNNKEFQLSKGKGIDSQLEIFEFDELNSEDNSKYSIFQDAKLLLVLESASQQFGIKFTNVEKYADRKYTGQFSNLDLEKALQMIFGPLGIQYTKKGNQIILE